MINLQEMGRRYIQNKYFSSLVQKTGCVLCNLSFPKFCPVASNTATCQPNPEICKHVERGHSRQTQIFRLDQYHGRICLHSSIVRNFGTGVITRDPHFASLENQDLVYFRKVLGPSGVVDDGDELRVASCDWTGKYKGNSKLLLRPTSSKQVSEVLQYCNERELAVVPQGGNTGLVGGSVPVFDEVILSLRNMNKIISFDEVSGILVCEAGCVLESLGTFLADRGFVVPLDLGAKGSCQIGGNVSTNAGGLRLLRYGPLHGSVLGLEAVLANGAVVDLLSTLRKDNTGYDLKQLFIGAEGTLGVVTKVSILCPPRSSSVHLAFLACSDYACVQATFMEARRQLGEILSAFEFMDRHALELVLTHLDGARDPLPDSKAPFYLVVETSGSNQAHDREKLDAFLESALGKGLLVDGTVAQDDTQAAAIWRMREGMAEALQRAGAVYKYDLSIPVKELYALVEVMRTRLEGQANVVAYGHLGDGNLHLNISTPSYSDQVLAQIEPFVYEWTAEKRGSISAEHGLGLMKASAIHYSKQPQAVSLMGQVKRLLDPRRILNPYKVLPPDAIPESVSRRQVDNLEATKNAQASTSSN